MGAKGRLKCLACRSIPNGVRASSGIASRPHVEFRERKVLDVGCGNGYYGWRMIQAGASLVLGFDPFLLFLMQFEVVRRYADPAVAHYVLPLTDAAIPARLNAFDVTLSMGVLYHRTSPIEHLLSLGHSLRPGAPLSSKH